jgi:hypothetical protein
VLYTLWEERGDDTHPHTHVVREKTQGLVALPGPGDYVSFFCEPP